MTTVLNPLAYNDIGTIFYYWFLLGTRNQGQSLTCLVGMQEAAVREVPKISRHVSGKGCEHCKSRFYSVSTRFSDTRFPQSGPCVNFMIKGGHTGSYK